jgi:RNA polymerase sigma factor (sigma-70 family)
MHPRLAEPLEGIDPLHSGDHRTPDVHREDDPWQTKGSLRVSLRDTADQQAWAEFVARSTPRISRWCETWFPREADDLVQEILAKLVKSLTSFEYRSKPGRFRGWPKTVTRHLMAELQRRNRLRVRCGTLDHPDLAAIEAAQTDLVQGLVAEPERELLGLACERVRPRVAPKTWAAFVETAHKGRRPAEVARERGLAVGSVYQARYQITRLLRPEVAALEGPL